MKEDLLLASFDSLKTFKVLDKTDENYKNKIYTFGYLDAVYEENEYIRYMPKDENSLFLYEEGYKRGNKDKEIGNFNPKESWIQALVISDLKNNYNDRNLTPEAKELYDYYYEIYKNDYVLEANRETQKQVEELTNKEYNDQWEEVPKR